MRGICQAIVTFTLICSVEQTSLFNRNPYANLFGRPGNDRQQSKNDHVTRGWFDQKQDHFNQTSGNTWKQQFWSNDQFYRPGGPVFLFIGGESRSGSFTIDPEIIFLDYLRNAQHFGAMCFQLEHRYFGLSWPTSDMSLENLQFLTTQQAIGDIGQFITEISPFYNLTGSKWVVFGGSYAGNLAAWSRQLLPDKIVGAVASSAPVEAITDFRDYFIFVSRIFSMGSPRCVGKISQAYEEIEQKLLTMEGRRELKAKFKLCRDVDPSNDVDITSLYYFLNFGILSAVQTYNGYGPSFAEQICRIMTRANLPTALDRYALVHRTFGLASGPLVPCLPNTYDFLLRLAAGLNFTDPFSADNRPWLYVLCNELNYFFTAVYDQPFGRRLTLNFYLQYCHDVFGFSHEHVYQGPERTNRFYGGRQNFNGTNIAFPNGSLDPWHLQGFYRDTPDPTVSLIYIYGGAHVADAFPPAPYDPPELAEARMMIRKNIAKWIR